MGISSGSLKRNKVEKGVAIMDVFTAISSRQSIRAFKSRDVEEEKLIKVLEAARLSPSTNNRQEWKFIVVRDEMKRQALVSAARGQQFVAQAPIVIVACATESESVMPCGQSAYTIDLSIATSYMILEAWELGLGTCWLGAFFEDQVRKILNIPENVRVVSMFPLGYPDVALVKKSRKSMDEVICFEEYK